MKFRSLCATSLVAVAALALAGGSVASASATQHDSTGTVEVKEGTDIPGTDSNVIDPENPDDKLPPNPDVKPNTNPGTLKITHVSDLKFGDIQTGISEQTSFAAALDYTASGDGTRGALVQFGDIRTKENGYTVKAAMTKQFTNAGGATLGGATLNYSNAILAQEAGSTGITPSTFVTSTATPLGEDGTPFVFVTADQTAKEGKGQWIMEFGQSSAYSETPAAGNATAGVGKDGESVQLAVPAATASSMAEGTYTATVTWTIEAAK